MVWGKKALFGIFALVLCIGIVSCDGNANDNPVIDDDDPFNISAVDFVSGMRVGWNLGNTFDAVSGGSSVSQLEAAWCGIVTTRENIDTIKDAGFNVIRIPVSWSKVADINNDYKIREDWMMRIMEVVLWALDNDMYVIINTHHDSGDQGTIFRFLNSNVEQSLERFTQIWEQIAETFKWFEEKLIFEPLNEPRNGNNWGGNAEMYNNINRHYQVFVDMLRASGGNNSKRFILFNAYAGSSSYAAMEGLKLPNDPATDKHLVSYHAYVPGNFAFGGLPGTTRGDTVDWTETNTNTSPITAPINQYYNKFVVNGIPVIIGEFGATNKENEAARARWVEFYTRSAMEKGMRVIWWDNAKSDIPENGNNNELFGLLNRRTNQIIYPLIMQGLLDGSN